MSEIALVFIACFNLVCHPVELSWDGSQQSCVLQGQQQVSQWLGEHRMVLQDGYRCEPWRPAA